VRSVAARVTRSRSELTVAYVVEGDLARLRSGTPLWQHTCLELFIGQRGSRAYDEYNFSLAGEWAAHAFADYRRKAVRDVPRPTVKFGPAGRLEARVAAQGSLRVGLSAVIEEEDGALSYWALRHPEGKPDFHHADAFALELDEDRH
jgi:hypothetical protein